MDSTFVFFFSIFSRPKSFRQGFSPYNFINICHSRSTLFYFEVLTYANRIIGLNCSYLKNIFVAENIFERFHRSLLKVENSIKINILVTLMYYLKSILWNNGVMNSGFVEKLSIIALPRPPPFVYLLFVYLIISIVLPTKFLVPWSIRKPKQTFN